MAIMSKRQRFFVELSDDKVTVISWKKLVADAERISASTLEDPAPLSPVTLNANYAPEKPRRRMKQAVPSSADTTTTERTEPTEIAVAERPKHYDSPLDIYTCELNQIGEEVRKRKSIVKAIISSSLAGKAAKVEELDDIAKQVALPPTPKGKVRRSLPASRDTVCSKSSRRTKKKTKPCICCSKKGRT